ncbi:MAG: excinuclease ABC subunit B, partial [Blastochloris sp.]|nr:excinuclease ABC subunit B [Blastochloris sp.]
VTDMDVAATILQLRAEMVEASEKLEYEKAALLRDQIRELEGLASSAEAGQQKEPVSYRKKRKR